MSWCVIYGAWYDVYGMVYGMVCVMVYGIA